MSPACAGPRDRHSRCGGKLRVRRGTRSRTPPDRRKDLAMFRSIRNKRHGNQTVAFDRAVSAMFEPLESRRLYAVTASAGGGVLTVLGDNNPNAITVSRDAAGNLLVNNGAVPITGATPATVANIQRIDVQGSDGNDAITLDETHGVLPKASL